MLTLVHNLKIKTGAEGCALLLVSLLHFDLLIVSAIGRVPAMGCQHSAHIQYRRDENILQKLLNEVHMRHDHAPAAIPLASKLI